MKKIERFEAIGKGLFWKEKKILIIGDLHLGYEEDLREKGLFFPETSINLILEDLDKIFKKTKKLKKIIFLGDVKHYFKGILKSEYRDFYRLIEKCKENLYKTGKIIITQGNHDNILRPIIEKNKDLDFVFLKKDHIEEDVLFYHGSKNKGILENYFLKNKKIKTIILGHFHPAINLKKGSKKEKYKIFLKSKIKNKKIIILPSFFPLNEGKDILDNGKINIFQKYKYTEFFNMKEMKIYVLDDNGKIYDFGDLNKLRKLID